MTDLTTSSKTTDIIPGNNAAPHADWRSFAAEILTTLADPEHRIWAYAAWHGSSVVSQTDHIPDATPARADEAAVDPWAEDYEASGILGLDYHVNDATDPSRPDPDAPEDSKRGRPRASVLTAVMRIARQFATLRNLLGTLAAPGAITFLSSGTPELDSTIEQILNAITVSDQRAPGVPKLTACTIEEVFAIGDRKRSGPFGAFSVGVKRWIEDGHPIVITGAGSAVMRPELQAMVSNVIHLVPFSREMLCEVLNSLYPGGEVRADNLPDCLGAAELGCLSPEALTIATRAATPTDAIRRLVADIPLPTVAGPGLADFPLQPAVREPVEQLLADMLAWQNGDIPWSDVSRGILLVGPPGCGKTELPRLIAKEAGITVHPASMAKWQSTGARSSDICREMRSFFTKAAAAAPCIVFIDELDTFGDRGRPQDHNSSWTDMVIGALLECLDGYETGEGVVVMAATNLLHKIDAALRRPGRFDRVVTVGHPTPDLMPSAFRWHLRDDLEGADLPAIAAAATGMTGAEVAESVRRARALARRACRPLTPEDLGTAIAERRPPLAEQLRWQVAVHECGHAIVAHATGRARPKLLSLHTGGGSADMTRAASNLRRADIDDEIACCLAGRAAERLIVGSASGGAGGTEDSDLAHATRVAAGIELSYGLGTSGTAWHGSPDAALYQMRLDPNILARVQIHLDDAEAFAFELLKTNRALLEDMARELMRTCLLTGPTLAALLARTDPQPTVRRAAGPPQQAPSDLTRTTTPARADRLWGRRRK
ncbi:AAA family ATPase [Pseudotabrizicola sediminis]|uniref:AAA family ATPase n=1 Tax=Pseudotabrizicola sediminis TaxID=2486418 RepID=A0ABY2KJ69_9RHOB|nr:AAA family ATPase [Pseudotabrizicola sediminis]TGD41799.1 AAA family ATPase [Pseudotabrizicola sediminis]